MVTMSKGLQNSREMAPVALFLPTDGVTPSWKAAGCPESLPCVLFTCFSIASSRDLCYLPKYRGETERSVVPRVVHSVLFKNGCSFCLFPIHLTAVTFQSSHGNRTVLVQITYSFFISALLPRT